MYSEEECMSLTHSEVCNKILFHFGLHLYWFQRIIWAFQSTSLATPVDWVIDYNKNKIDWIPENIHLLIKWSRKIDAYAVGFYELYEPWILRYDVAFGTSKFNFETEGCPYPIDCFALSLLKDPLFVPPGIWWPRDLVWAKGLRNNPLWVFRHKFVDFGSLEEVLCWAGCNIDWAKEISCKLDKEIHRVDVNAEDYDPYVPIDWNSFILKK